MSRVTQPMLTNTKQRRPRTAARLAAVLALMVVAASALAGPARAISAMTVVSMPDTPISDVRSGEGSGYGSSGPVSVTTVPISDVRSGQGYGDGVPADFAPATAVTVADGSDVSVLAFVLSLAGMAVLAAAASAAVSSRARRGQRHPA